jgi:hypothetical protein
MDNLESIAAQLTTDGPDVPASTVAQLRFQLEFGLLMLGCGRDDGAAAAFHRAFELLDELEA